MAPEAWGGVLLQRNVDSRTDDVAHAALRLAEAIGSRDVATIRSLLAPGFTHRTHCGPVVDAESFLRAIEEIPGEISSVQLQHMEVDLCPSGALVTGIQHAQVRVNGALLDDRRGFVDWFVHDSNGWRIQAAVDLTTHG